VSVSANLFREEIIERLHGAEFIVFDIEDGVELRNKENVANFLAQREKFEFTAPIFYSGVAGHEFAYSGRIDVIHLRQIEHDFLFAGGNELMDDVTQLSCFIAEGDAAMNIDDGDVANFARGDGHSITCAFIFLRFALREC
jgi:hypothetical protein